MCVCVSQVLKGAAVLQIECLQRRCEEFLSRSLSINNCITRWRLAHWHSCMHLSDRVSSMLLFETPLPVYHSSSRDTVSTMPCLPPASSSSQYYALSPQCLFQPTVLCLISLLPVPALRTVPCSSPVHNYTPCTQVRRGVGIQESWCLYMSICVSMCLDFVHNL